MLVRSNVLFKYVIYTSIFFLSVSHNASAAMLLQKVVVSGEQAAGATSGVVYSSFEQPMLNMNGQVAFAGTLSGTGISTANDHAIWSGSTDSINMVARTGDTAPGTDASLAFSSFDSLTFNNLGQTAFYAEVAKIIPTDLGLNGIWSEGSGTLAPVVISRQIAPGIEPVQYFGAFYELRLNDAGQTAFYSNMSDITTTMGDKSIWIHDQDGLKVVAREQGSVPGESTNYVFFGMNPYILPLNDAGEVIFRSGTRKADGSLSSYTAIWAGSAETLGPVVSVGDAAPGIESDVFFAFSINTNNINNAGQAVLRTGLYGEGIGLSLPNTIASLWFYGPDTLVQIARNGDPAPGLEPDTKYKYLSTSCPLNGNGHFTYYSLLSGPEVDDSNDQAIWYYDSGDPIMITREGERAAGTAPGVVFSDVGLVSLNNHDQFVYYGILSGTGVDELNDRGFWVWDPEHGHSLIVREGEWLNVSDDPEAPDWRQIMTLHAIGSHNLEDSSPQVFNDSSELVFQVTFVDGTEGIYIATIPEPVSVLLLGLMLPMVLRRSA